MPIDVFDCHQDLRHAIAAPQMRARFLRMEPGERAPRHSHDLGAEVVLVLEGQVRVEIEQDTTELSPGQLCVVRADQTHRVSAVGDEPATIFMSGAPHVQPTHTDRDAVGERGELRFLPNATYDIEDDSRIPVEESIDHFVELVEDLSAITRTAAEEQRMAAARLTRALTARNLDTADRQREIMWFGLFRIYEKLFQLTDQWNRIAPRAGRSG